MLEIGIFAGGVCLSLDELFIFTGCCSLGLFLGVEVGVSGKSYSYFPFMSSYLKKLSLADSKSRGRMTREALSRATAVLHPHPHPHEYRSLKRGDQSSERTF